MLSASELANLGCVDVDVDVDKEINASEVLTSVYSKFKIKGPTLKSLKKLKDLVAALKDIRDISNGIEGTYSTMVDIDNIKKGYVYFSFLFENPSVMETAFVKVFDSFTKLSTHTDMVEQICMTGEAEMENCRMTLSRFGSPPKFVVVQSFSDPFPKTDEDNNAGGGGRKVKMHSKDDIICSLGVWKIKEETLKDEAKFDSLSKSLKAYNTAMLEIEDVLVIALGVSKELGEFYFQEHYGSSKAIYEQSIFMAMNRGEIKEHLVPSEMVIFTSENSQGFIEDIVAINIGPEKLTLMKGMKSERE